MSQNDENLIFLFSSHAFRSVATAGHARFSIDSPANTEAQHIFSASFSDELSLILARSVLKRKYFSFIFIFSRRSFFLSPFKCVARHNTDEARLTKRAQLTFLSKRRVRTHFLLSHFPLFYFINKAITKRVSQGKSP